MYNVENGVDCWCRIAQTVNKEILDHGAIVEGNTRIWAILHPFTDDDWRDMLSTFGQFNADHGEFVSLSEYKTWTDAVEQFEQYHGVLRGDAPGYSCMDYYQRDKRKPKFSTKGKSWNMIMVMREVYCRIGNLNIPNR